MSSLYLVLAIAGLFCLAFSLLFLPAPWVAIGFGALVIASAIVFVRDYHRRKKDIEKHHKT